MAEATRISFRDKLQRWRYLEKERRILEERIPSHERRLLELGDRLTAPGIQSSITQKYEMMLLGIPRASGDGDKISEQVAGTLERIEKFDTALKNMRVELVDVQMELEYIQDKVSTLRKDYQNVLELYFRDQYHVRQIATRLNVAEITVYKMVEKAIKAIDANLWRG